MSPIRFEMRLDEDILERLDRWRAKQSDVPSRAEAVRRLLGIGLAKADVKISEGEKLILMMLRDQHNHLKVNGDTDPEFIQNMLLGGHYWSLDWRMPGLFHDHVDNRSDVHEVVNVLEMWSFIESGFANLSRAEKERVISKAGIRGKKLAFLGFDGNTESNLISIARFLINDLERFEHFKDRRLNSHSPSIQVYRRMLGIFQPMLARLIGRELEADEIISLLNARYGSA